jgi:hypothetical protein
LTTLCWAFSIRFYEPDQIYHECVTPFPELVFVKIFAAKVGVPKSTHARDIPDGHDCTFYTSDFLVFSPADVGVPSERKRKYGRFDVYPFLKTTMKSHLFAGFFFRRLFTNASIYLAASVSQQECELSNLHSRQHNVHEDQGGFQLSSSQSGHLEGYMILAQKRGLLTKSHEWIVPCALANAVQSSDFMSQINVDVFPAVMRKSILYDLVAQRPVLVAELWLVQGIPRPHMLPAGANAIEQEFPFPQLLPNKLAEFGQPGVLSLSEQKSLLGNCMHWAQISPWLLFGAVAAVPTNSHYSSVVVNPDV